LRLPGLFPQAILNGVRSLEAGAVMGYDDPLRVAVVVTVDSFEKASLLWIDFIHDFVNNGALFVNTRGANVSIAVSL
jgi:hypothetical protein